MTEYKEKDIQPGIFQGLREREREREREKRVSQRQLDQSLFKLEVDRKTNHYGLSCLLIGKSAWRGYLSKVDGDGKGKHTAAGRITNTPWGHWQPACYTHFPESV